MDELNWKISRCTNTYTQSYH